MSESIHKHQLALCLILYTNAGWVYAQVYRQASFGFLPESMQVSIGFMSELICEHWPGLYAGLYPNIVCVFFPPQVYM